MSLVDRVQKVNETFDATKDNPNAAANIPAGSYNVLVDGVRVFISEKTGYHGLRLSFEVVDDEYAGRKENTIINYDELSPNGKQIPDFIINRNIKVTSRFANAVGIQLQLEDWADDETSLANALHTSVGKVILMHITESPNKKDPANPYRNYDFEPSDMNIEAPEISDDEMPGAMAPTADEEKPAVDPFANADATIEVNDDDMPF